MKSVSISFVLKWFILPFQATAFVLLHNMKRPLGGQSFKINTVLWFIIVIRLTNEGLNTCFSKNICAKRYRFSSFY